MDNVTSNIQKSDHDLLIEISTKLDTALRQGGDHETRIRSIERKIYGMSGAATIAGAILGLIADKLHFG